jgi:hypothetical protein
MSRNREARVVYGTVSDKCLASKQKKESNALAHFSVYLKSKRGIHTPIEFLPYDQIDHDLMGGFLKYLAEDARSLYYLCLILETHLHTEKDVKCKNATHFHINPILAIQPC